MSEKFLTKRVKCKHFSIPFNKSIGYSFLCRKFTPTSYEQCPCAAIEEPEVKTTGKVVGIDVGIKNLMSNMEKIW